MAGLILPGTIPALTIGSRVFTDLQNLIQLCGYTNGASQGYCTLRKPGASSGYTPSGAKTFLMLAARVQMTTQGFVFWAYADNDVGFQVATVPTNLVYPAGNINALAVSQPNNTIFDVDLLGFTVPNGKYAQIHNNAGTGVSVVHLYGYEQ